MKKTKYTFFSLDDLISEVKIPDETPKLCEEYFEYVLKTKDENIKELRSYERDFLKLFLSTSKENHYINKMNAVNSENNQLPLKEIPKKNTNQVSKKQGPLDKNLSLLMTFNINPAKSLSINFTVDQNNDVTCYFYTITFQNQRIITKPYFGLLFPFELKVSLCFPILDPKTQKRISCIIQSQEKLKIKKNDFDSIIIYHMKLCSDIFLKKLLTEAEIQDGIKRMFEKNTSEKKYLFVPVEENSFLGNFEINFEKIKYCNRIQKKETTVKDTLEEEIKNFFLNKEINASTQNEFKKQVLSEQIYIPRYKICYMYDLFDLFYYNETAEVFLTKLTCDDKTYFEKSRGKYFQGITDEMMKTLTTRELMTNFSTVAPSVTGFRDLPLKYELDFNLFPDFYSYGRKLSLVCDSLIYNKNITQRKKLEDKDQVKKNIIYPIFPTDVMLVSYLTKRELEMVFALPSVMLNVEALLLPYESIEDLFGLSLEDITFKKFLYFQWGMSTPENQLDFDYESLETLGDSILKVLTTLTLYYDDQMNPTGIFTGVLEKRRVLLIRNSHLFHKGEKMGITNYMISKTMDINSYNFPLKVESSVPLDIHITEKSIADVVESSIGAIFLYSQDILKCYEYIVDKVKLFSNEEYAEEKIYSLNDEKLFNKVKEGFKSLKGFQYPDMMMIKFDITVKELLSMFKAEFKEDSEIGSIEDLEEKCLRYKFQNRDLLIKALTHSSFEINSDLNCEKLELLGDSIVEAFISCSLFNIFGPYMFIDPSEYFPDDTELVKVKKEKAELFNNVQMTRIKSLLCSNNFMCKLSAFLHLMKFLKYGKGQVLSGIKSFMAKENLERILNRNFDLYEDYQAITPKFAADAFEAVVGAIYIDGGMKKCYEFLKYIYGPFISYTSRYFDKMKYSVIDDFIIYCEHHFKIVPEFKTSQTKEGITIDVFLNGKLITSASDKNENIARQHAAFESLKIVKKDTY